MRNLGWMIGCIVLVTATVTAGAFPGWRGPTADGRIAPLAIPATWPVELERLFKLEVGAGLASPVHAAGHAFILTRDGDDEVVRSVRLADGGVAWIGRYPSHFHANQQATNPRLFPVSRGRGPFATPVIVGRRLLTLGVERVLTGWDAETGDVHWRRRFYNPKVPDKLVYVCPPCGMECDGKEYASPGKCPNPDCPAQLSPQGLETTARADGGNYYGAASSPIAGDALVGAGRAVVQVGNRDETLVIALDLATGEDIWRWRGAPIASASPTVATIHGVRQVVVVTRESVVGLDLADGRELWLHPLESNAQIVTPSVASDLVIYASYQGPLTAVRLVFSHEQWYVERAWDSPELTLEMSSPIVTGNRVVGFSFSEKGSFFSVDTMSGIRAWRSEGRVARAATILAAPNGLLALTDDGLLRVLAPGDAYRELARYQVATSPTWAGPAVADGLLLVKEAEHLTAWRLPTAAR